MKQFLFYLLLTGYSLKNLKNYAKNGVITFDIYNAYKLFRFIYNFNFSFNSRNFSFYCFEVFSWSLFPYRKD